MPVNAIDRRRWLQGTAALAALCAAPARAQAPKASRTPFVAQIVDVSNEQQDVSKDFLIGSRAAWQESASRGGLRGRPVGHLAVEVDGTEAGLRAALAQLADNPACVALSGTASDPVAALAVAQLRKDGLALAHAAPWLQNSSIETDERTFPIFATRQEQIGHALKSLTVMGVQELGAVYASAREHGLYREDVERIATTFRLRLQSYAPTGDLKALGQRVGQGSAAILLFIGGTPELVQFTQGLEKQARQRYLIALADVNLQTMLQMGGSRSTPVIATQAVPMTSQSSLPVVRAYRDTMARLFDEPPTPLSLAGYIAARYTQDVMAEVDGPLTRASVLQAFQRRASVDVGGFRVTYQQQRRGASYVTQTMLSADGRVIG